MNASVHHEAFRGDAEHRGGSDRQFGVVFALFFVVAGVWPVFNRGGPRIWAVVLAAVFLGFAVARPSALHPLNRLWTAVGMLLGKITAPLVTGALFYLVFTPAAMAMRWMKKDPLRLRLEAGASTYWMERKPARAGAGNHAESVLRKVGDVSFLMEFCSFLKARKKFWLLPILLITTLFGALLIFAQGSAVAPFIYTLF